MLERAMRLCGASFGTFLTYDGEFLHFVAARGHSRYGEWARQQGPIGVYPGTTNQRLLRGEAVVQVTDLAESEEYRLGYPGRRAQVEIGGFQTLLSVALRKDATLLGTLHLHRQEARPFTEKQIALLQNFAAQAVIAMENARLINETREALEQQTATAEVLGVINSSPGELEPVFDAMLEKAVCLCEADFGVLWTFDGDRFRPAAMRGVPVPWAEFLTNDPTPFGAGSGPARVLAGQRFHQVVDFQTDPLTLSGDPHRRALVELAGARTGCAVSLRKDDALLGVFLVFRREVRPFSERQIALLLNFGDQAVIAMENARLLTETREALEQQTATAEVLQVINSSPGDLLPVFEAIVERAHTLCDAVSGSLQLWDGEKFRGVAMRGFSQAMVEVLRQGYVPGPKHPCRRLLEGAGVAHCLDLAEIDDPATRAGGVALGGIRIILFVALRKDDVLLGQIVAARREVRPFSEKEIALVENFAAQAVIAMENARLITETREALEQQTATAEVLQVINSSPGDLAPVFDAILEK